MLEWKLPTCQVELIEGSIVELDKPFDALVSSDDNYLGHSGGVSRQLWARAGRELDEWVRNDAPRLSLGDVYDTRAYGLPARYLLHAITIDFDQHRRLNFAEARALYRNVFDRAEALGCTSVAFPLLGAGAGRLSPVESASAAVEAIGERLGIPSVLSRLALVVLPSVGSKLRALFESRLAHHPDLEEAILAVGRTDDVAGHKLVEAWSRFSGGDGGPFAAVSLLEAALEVLVTKAPGGGGHRLVLDRDGGSSTGLASLLRLAEKTYEGLGRPLPRELAQACWTAVEARNRLVHTPDGPDVQRLERQILHAVSRILSSLPSSRVAEGRALPSVSSMIAPAIARALDERGRPRRPSDGRGRREPGPHPSNTGADEHRANLPGGTDHVRWLHRFLLEEMDPANYAFLQRHLEHEGYRGKAEDRLLERCVREPSPDQLLIECLGPAKLYAALEKQTGEPPETFDAKTLARRLLEANGFPEIRDRPDLSNVEEQLRDLRRSTTAGDINTVVGAVSRASSLLEEQLELLLRFLCQVVFATPAEVYFREKSPAGGKPLEKWTLGTLLDATQHLAKDIAADTSDRGRVLRDALGTGRLIPDEASTLPARRNALIHDRAHTNAGEAPGRVLPAQAAALAKLRNDLIHWEESGGLDDTQRRRAAQEFIDGAIACVRHLATGKNRVFPHVVRIKRIVIDAHGRRTVVADGEGGVEETIFCDLDLQPGQLYFMHPTTNPLRVDPILVPAGEVERRTQRRREPR